MHFVLFLGIALIIAMWAMGEQELRTKVILTVVYLLTWGLTLIDPRLGPFLFAAQCLWCVVVGYWTFGKDFRK